MSKRRKLVFWPRVEGAANYHQISLEAKCCDDIGSNNTPEELSETESDAYYCPFDFRRTIPLADKLYKIIIVGDPTVGKTSFVQRYVEDTFRRDYKGTVGVDFALKIVQWTDLETIKIQLWDIAGQERFTWMTRVYYKDAHGCVVMFDLANKNSFANTVKWKKDVDSKCMLPDGSPIPCMLVANKCDLPNRKIEQLEIEGLFKRHHFVGWTETSAKTGEMVNDSIKFLVEVMMKQESGRQVNQMNIADTVMLTGPDPDTEKKWKCNC